MKILFYDTKSYDREFFEKLLPSYPGIEIKFIEANIHEETAALAHGYDAICAFVNADLGAPVIEELHRQGVKLILMRCAGYNNVDLETTQNAGSRWHVFPVILRKQLPSTPWHWHLPPTGTPTRHISNAVKITLH